MHPSVSEREIQVQQEVQPDFKELPALFHDHDVDYLIIGTSGG
jgi:hypothetical protein